MTDAEKIEALISVLKYLIESSDKYIEESSWLATLNADIHLARTTIKHIEENRNDKRNRHNDCPSVCP